MRRFVFGKLEQFTELDIELEDGNCHVYHECILPDICEPKIARIGFERNIEGYYILYIDKGIEAISNKEDFSEFLRRGEMKFANMEEMVSFLTSLQPLFDSKETPKEKEEVTSVYNKERVNEIRTEKKEEKMVWPEEIATLLKKKVFGQDEAIEDISTKVVKNRLKKKSKLLVMALIGPTATGKSETAKSLSEILSETCDVQYDFIEVAGSEFQEEQTVSRFFGAPPGYVGYGNDTVLEPVRKNPYHVIVINEIEKAHTKILTGLMEAIDTGVVGMADNSQPININNCILLFTSNIPIDLNAYRESTRFQRNEMCKDAFTKHCGRPEISGKIGNFIVFQELSDEAILDIVVKFVREELRNYDLHLVRIDDHLMADFLKNKSKYGARAIRDMVSDSLGEYLLNNRRLEVLKNKEVSIKGTLEHLEFIIN